MNVVQSQKQEIARFIYSQMMEHFHCDTPEVRKTGSLPFTRIEEHNFAKFKGQHPPLHGNDHAYQCHPKQDIHRLQESPAMTATSSTRRQRKILPSSLKPIDGTKMVETCAEQFRIYWKHNTKQYHPDFVAETVDVIFMVETKKEGDMEAVDVQEKSQAAHVL